METTAFSKVGWGRGAWNVLNVAKGGGWHQKESEFFLVG